MNFLFDNSTMRGRPDPSSLSKGSGLMKLIPTYIYFTFKKISFLTCIIIIWGSSKHTLHIPYIPHYHNLSCQYGDCCELSRVFSALFAISWTCKWLVNYLWIVIILCPSWEEPPIFKKSVLCRMYFLSYYMQLVLKYNKGGCCECLWLFRRTQ